MTVDMQYALIVSEFTREITLTVGGARVNVNAAADTAVITLVASDKLVKLAISKSNEGGAKRFRVACPFFTMDTVDLNIATIKSLVALFNTMVTDKAFADLIDKEPYNA